MGHFGLFRNTFERQFFLAHGVDGNDDFGGRGTLLLDLLHDDEGGKDDEQEKVSGRRTSKALVEKAGDVAPALEEIDEGDQGGEGE